MLPMRRLLKMEHLSTGLADKIVIPVQMDRYPIKMIIENGDLFIYLCIYIRNGTQDYPLA